MRFVFLAVLLFAGHARAEGQFADVNGIRMYYESHGQGTPLVALHGFGGSSAMWQRFIADFSKEYRLIIPDLRGHGRSTNPTNQFTHRQSALDVYALLDHLGIRQFKAMGVSTGGMTLLHMATQQPARVEAFVWIGATTYFPEQAREIMRRSTVESVTPAEWERMRSIHKNGDDQIRALRNEFHNFKDSYEDMNFTPPLLGTISARTLIVHGDRDEFFPVAIPTDAYRAIPHSYLWIVPNGGHVPIVEHAAEFTKTALEFLRGDWEKK
jgi:pimeloyl-ACP methyl ester carboxylesterase